MKRFFTLVIFLMASFILVSGALAADYDPQFPDYDEWFETWKQENPRELAIIKQDSPPLWQDYGYASRTEFMNANGLVTYAEYIDRVVEERGWDKYFEAMDAYYAVYDAQWAAQTRVELGGESEGLGVMLNDRYIKFGDAKPELVSGRTMVPLRALAEAIGAEVGWDDATRRVTVSMDGYTVSFTVGESSVAVSANGAESTLAMDCATYIKNDSTYVPVRFFTEAMGCDVLWDELFNTAVVLDRSAIVSWADENFTQVNKLLSLLEQDPNETYRSVTELAASITRFSTLDGDTTYSMRGKITVISSGASASLSLTLDMDALLDFVMDNLGGELPPEELAEIRASLNNAELDMIVNGDEGVTYLRCPLLMEELGLEDTSAWIMFDELYAPEEDLPVYSSLNASTMGERLYMNAIMSTAWGYPVFAVQYMDEAAYAAAQLIGDAQFTVSGSTATLRFTRESYEMLSYGEIPEDESAFDFKELDVVLTISDYGAITASGSFALRENPYDYGFYYGGDVRYSGSFSLSKTNLTVHCEIHADNSYLAKIDVTSNRNVTAESVPAGPPDGSVIYSADELELDVPSTPTDLLPFPSDPDFYEYGAA